jgi:metal-sulfur cluster biosynthetic enzyme
MPGKKLNKEIITEKLRTVKDPELGLDIVSLGLVRGVEIDDDGVEVLMTLTSPFCPFADELIQSVEKEVGKLPESGDVRVEITFDPPWEPPEDVKDALGLE